MKLAAATGPRDRNHAALVTNLGTLRHVAAWQARPARSVSAGSAMPFAFDISPPVSDEQTRRRAASNQALVRVVNEAMRVDRPDEAIAFRCECGQIGCNQLIELTRAEYKDVRAHPRRFAIVAGHEIDEIETIVERHDRYAVVEAHDPAAAAIAERTSPGPQPHD